MANNRLFLVCDICGQTCYLGKRMGVGWYGAPEHTGESLNDFYDEHEWCTYTAAGMSMGISVDNFSMAYEDGPGHWLGAKLDHVNVEEEGGPRRVRWLAVYPRAVFGAQLLTGLMRLAGAEVRVNRQHGLDLWPALREEALGAGASG